MKKIAAAMLSLGLLVGSCSTALAADPDIYYNGQPLTLHQPAVIQDGRTLLGLRDMAEQMQVEVQWDSMTRLATIRYKDTEITLQPDLKRVVIDGQEQQLDVGPQIIEDRIYLPVRYLFELLDGDVFYRSYEDGTTVISVNTSDSYTNYVTVAGRQTKVVRNVDGSTGNPVIMTHDGNVLELVMNGSTINLYRTTQGLNRTSLQTESATTYQKITGVLEDKNQYYAILDHEQPSYYVGYGYEPLGSAVIEEIYTPQGRFSFHESQATVSTLALENTSGFNRKKVQGYLLNIGSSDREITDRSYAFNDNSGYGFLTDGQLLLIGNVPAKGFQVLSCNTISDTMKTGTLFTQGSDFYAIGADTTEDGNQEIFVTSYNEQGNQMNSYIAVSHLSDNETYRYVRITDSVQIGDKAYLLLQTNYSRYLACYDLVAHTFTAEKLNQPYEKFVQANGSWQLFYCDADYYNFLQVR